MELRDYISVVWRRKWVVIFTIVFSLLAAVLAVMQTPVEYTATNTIRILTTKSGGTDYIDYDIEYSERLIGTYVQIANSDPIIEELKQYVDRVPKLDIQVVPSTELITISATDADPGLAQFTANKLAEIIINQSKQIYSNDVSPINIYVAEPAILPTEPSSMCPWVIFGLAALVGVVGGLGLAFLFENLDTRLYTVYQVESVTKLPVIGDIPEYRGSSNAEIFQDSLTHIEAFRRLRTNIFTASVNGSMKSILITSAIKQDGRSAVLANLALCLAQGNRSIVVVDANLRYPLLHEIFGVGNEVGLTDILQGSYSLSGALQKTSFKNITALTSGPIPGNPSELLDSKDMTNILNELKAKYDVVLVDSPSSVSVTDPAILAAKVDGVILVVRQGWVRKEALVSTLKHLKNVEAKLIGVVVNRTDLGVSKRHKVHVDKTSKKVEEELPA